MENSKYDYALEKRLLLFSKMQQTLDECRSGTNDRTDYLITQKEIVRGKM